MLTLQTPNHTAVTGTEPEAIETYYRLHRDRLTRYAAVRLGDRDRDLAPDLVHDAFADALSDPGSLADDPVGGLLRLTARACTRHTWSQRRYVRAALTVGEDQQVRGEQPPAVDLDPRLVTSPRFVTALARLTANQRLAFQLRWLDGYPRDAVAVAMNRTPGAVGFLERAALRRLATQLADLTTAPRTRPVRHLAGRPDTENPMTAAPYSTPMHHVGPRPTQAPMPDAGTCGQDLIDLWHHPRILAEVVPSSRHQGAAACRTVLAASGPGWETLDLTATDLNTIAHTFWQQRADLSLSSRSTYVGIFDRSVRALLSLRDGDVNWLLPTRSRRPAATAATAKRPARPEAVKAQRPSPRGAAVGEMEVRLALPEGGVASLRLPASLTAADAVFLQQVLTRTITVAVSPSPAEAVRTAGASA